MNAISMFNVFFIFLFPTKGLIVANLVFLRPRIRVVKQPYHFFNIYLSRSASPSVSVYPPFKYICHR